MSPQVFVDGAPTRCDRGKEPIAAADEWFECDAWHLCRGCYDALMDGPKHIFDARFSEEAPV